MFRISNGALLIIIFFNLSCMSSGNTLLAPKLLVQNLVFGEQFVGSNAWVVSGEFTQSGAPIIANDPHLNVQQPSIWYAMQLTGNKLNVTGMSMVGLPGIILGRNRHIAWAATNLMSDQQDLFIINVSLKNNNLYVTDLGNKTK